MHKIINSTCVCGYHLSKYKSDLIVILPCQHLIHSCCTKYIKQCCPICKKKIKNIRTQTEVYDIAKKGHPIYYQIYVDMRAIGNHTDDNSVSIFSLLCRVPGIIDNMANLYMAQHEKDAYRLVTEILDTCNIKIVVKNIDKILNSKKVIISNHSHAIDSLSIYKVFQCGFVTSTNIYDYWFGRKLASLLPLVLVDRGKSKNTTKEIKKYINIFGDICLYPEGYCSHPKTLARYRTGAFVVGYPVQPVVISYQPNIYFWNAKTFMMKLYSQKKITVTITVLDPVYPPFNKNKIEEIRYNMARVGDLAVSRVSNKDMTE